MARYLDTIVLVTLTALVALRPLVAETYDYRTDAISVATAGVADPTPIRTLAFDSVILACGLLCLAARAIDWKTGYCRTGLGIGSILLVIAAVISCAAAGQKRIAITASLDWLCYLALAATLAQVMRTRSARRIVVTAILASAAVQVFACCEQSAYGFEETWETYQAHKAEFWSRQGVDLESPQVALFERRMQAREASGTFNLSNVAGSYLVLCGILGLAVSLAAVRSLRGAAPLLQLSSIVGLVLSGGMLATVYLTGSLGAMLTGALGVVAVVLFNVVPPRVWLHRRSLFYGAWATALAGIVGVVVVGLARGSLPGSSLGFRWQYWTNSASMIADHPLAGVGRENFGRRYLAYKPITSAEEVSNPHNILVQSAAEWGVPGLLGVLLVIFGSSRVLAGVATRGEQRDEAAEVTGRSQAREKEAVLLLLIGLAVVIGRLGLGGSNDTAWLYYIGMTTLLIWGGAAAFVCVMMRRADGSAVPGYLATGCLAAFAMFLIHECISFAIFVPGAATTFFAIVAVGLAQRGRVMSVAPRARRLALIPAVAAVAAVVWIAVVPPVRAEIATDEALRVAGGEPDAASAERCARLMKAVFVDPLDTHALWVWLSWLHAEQQASSGSDVAETGARIFALAIQRDPFNRSWYVRQMHFYRELAEASDDETYWRRAVDAAKSALRLYPQHPRGLIELADCERAAGEDLGDQSLLQDAVKKYEDALALDRRRPAGEVLHRLSTKKTTEVQKVIARLRTMLAKSPGG